MAIYVITYDLQKEPDSSGYRPLIDDLKKRDAFKFQKSAWLLNTSSSATEVKNHYQQLVDQNDLLWVSRVRAGQYDWSRALNGMNEWLKANPPD